MKFHLAFAPVLAVAVLAAGRGPTFPAAGTRKRVYDSSVQPGPSQERRVLRPAQPRDAVEASPIGTARTGARHVMGANKPRPSGAFLQPRWSHQPCRHQSSSWTDPLKIGSA